MPRAKAKKATPSHHQRLFLLIAVAFFALAGWEYNDYQHSYQHHVQQLEHKLTQAQNRVLKPVVKTTSHIHLATHQLANQIANDTIRVHSIMRQMHDLIQQEPLLKTIKVQLVDPQQSTTIAYTTTREADGIHQDQQTSTAPTSQQLEALSQQKHGIWAHQQQDDQPTGHFSMLVRSHQAPHRPLAVIEITIDPSHWSKLPLVFAPQAQSYAYLITHDHMIIAHPNHKLIGKTLFTQHEEAMSVEKVTAPLQSLLKKSGGLHYTHHKSQQQYWVLVKQIKPSNLYIVYKINQSRWYQFLLTLQPKLVWTALWLSIGLIAGIMFLSHQRVKPGHQWRLLATLITVFSCALIALLLYFTMQANKTHINRTTAILNPVQLQKFLQQHQNKLKHTTPIPTGIEVKSIYENQKRSSYEIHAILWQQFPTQDRAKAGRILFANGTQLTSHQDLYRFQGNGQTMGGIEAVFHVKHHSDLSHYPFDSTMVHIDMLSSDLNQPVLLIPDFDSYAFHDGSSLPGISDSLQQSNPQIHEAYFDLQPNHIATGSNLGIQNFNTKAPYILSYNIQISRNVIKALISYFIPLLVIIIICYIVSTMIDLRRQDAVDNKLGLGSGLLFVIALTQIRFHQSFNTSMVTYYDALLMYMYLLVLATTTAAVMHAKNIPLPWIESKITENSRYQSIFWPMNAVIILLITFVFFV